MNFNFMRRIQLSKNESISISVLMLLLFASYLHFWQAPRSAQLKSIQEKIAISKADIAKNQALIKSISNRSPASDELSASRNLMEQYLKSNEKFSSVVTSIVSGSKNSSFSLTKISAENQTKINGYAQTLYNLEAEASFISIGKFLERLEDSPLLTEVQSIEIQRLEDEMQRCKVNIKLFGYVMGGEK